MLAGSTFTPARAGSTTGVTVAFAVLPVEGKEAQLFGFRLVFDALGFEPEEGSFGHFSGVAGESLGVK